MNNSSIVLAGGCFWCLDAVYRHIHGVKDVISGYAGGNTAYPGYYDVVSGITGHAESVQVMFDSTIIDEKSILDVFWSIHDPTSLNRQGADVGTQYRSAIFYTDDSQRQRAEASMQKAQAVWDNAIVTEITQLEKFYPAEPEHQNYFENHPERAYCVVVINPKLSTLRQKFEYLLKD